MPVARSAVAILVQPNKKSGKPDSFILHRRPNLPGVLLPGTVQLFGGHLRPEERNSIPRHSQGPAHPMHRIFGLLRLFGVHPKPEDPNFLESPLAGIDRELREELGIKNARKLPWRMMEAFEYTGDDGRGTSRTNMVHVISVTIPARKNPKLREAGELVRIDATRESVLAVTDLAPFASQALLSYLDGTAMMDRTLEGVAV